MSKPEISTSAPDRISTLIHILSSLPAKKAFATRILSKRWIHLCCCVLDLDLSDVNWEDRDHFVYSVLQLRKAAGIHSINSFIMDNGRYSPRLRDIVVGSWEKVTPELPTSILASTTLVVLKLGTFNMRADFHLNMIRLPSLKTLHLKHIMFKHVEDLALILEKCPVLEDLELHSITSEGIYCHKSSEKKLRKLNRADITMCCCYIPMKALSNLKFLRIQLTKDYHHPYDFPEFHNLTHLKLNYYWDMVVKVLHQCPKLQKLELYQKMQGYNWVDQENWVPPKFVPVCLSSNLRSCTMKDFEFSGQQSSHIMLARFVMENARILETMSILCYGKWYEIKRALSACPRASATCQLSIDNIYDDYAWR